MNRLVYGFEDWVGKITGMQEITVVGVITVGIAVVLICLAVWGAFKTFTTRE